MGLLYVLHNKQYTSPHQIISFTVYITLFCSPPTISRPTNCCLPLQDANSDFIPTKNNVLIIVVYTFLIMKYYNFVSTNKYKILISSFFLLLRCLLFIAVCFIEIFVVISMKMVTMPNHEELSNRKNTLLYHYYILCIFGVTELLR